MRCGVADEPVVVMKSRPKKPSNGVEEKTEMIPGKSGELGQSQKRVQDAKGRSEMKGLWKWRNANVEHKRTDGSGNSQIGDQRIEI